MVHHLIWIRTGSGDCSDHLIRIRTGSGDCRDHLIWIRTGSGDYRDHLFNPRIEFLNEAKIHIKCISSARIWGLYLSCLCFEGFPFVWSLQERGFPEVADWLTVQWSLVVKSWALAEDVELGSG